MGDKRIIELENKSIRFSSLRIERKKELKKKWTRSGRHHQNTNICLLGVPEEERKAERLFGEIMAPNFPNKMKNNTPIQEANKLGVG